MMPLNIKELNSSLICSCQNRIQITHNIRNTRHFRIFHLSSYLYQLSTIPSPLKMFSMKILALLALSAAPLAYSLPSNSSIADGDYWAQFCDDTGCSQGCGQSVQVSNPGCLNESGRRSILFHGSAGQDYRMVVSPSGDCPCQQTCASIPTDVTCWDISLYQNAQSFRFQSETCASDNC